LRVAQNVRGFNTNTSKMMARACARAANLEQKRVKWWQRR